MGGIMKVTMEDIRKVLALFDKEDIPYINFDYLFNHKILECDNTENKSDYFVKIKKRGGKYDRSRK